MMLPFSNSCIEAGLQSEVYACNVTSECPPGDFYCDSYLSSYVHYRDTAAKPIRYGIWGHCNIPRHAIKRLDESNNAVPVEICDNGKDDSGNGKVDCGDPECVTAPRCKTRIMNTCDANPSNIDGNINCEELMERHFPFVAKDGNCPDSVGIKVEMSSGEKVCLPRCRLYLKRNSANNNTDADFAGSDNYCDMIVFEKNSSIMYWNEKPSCQHMGFVQPHTGYHIQNDVCLPAGSMVRSSCDGCEKCVPVNYFSRNMLTYEENKVGTAVVPSTKMIAGNEITEFEKTAYVCLD